MIDGLLLLAAICFTASKIGKHEPKIQVDKFVNDGELHVLEHFILGQMVIGRIKDLDDGSLGVTIPMDVA